MKILLALLFVAHGLVHASFVAPAPKPGEGPQWPFEMANSWLVTGLGVDVGPAKAVGTVLVVVVVVGFAATGLATLGALVPPSWWAPLAAASSIASAVLLALFFHPWLVLGFAIDAAVLWAALAAGWTPSELATR